MSVASGGASLARLVSVLLHPFVVIVALVLLASWRFDPASLPRNALGLAVVVAVAWGFVAQRRRAGHWQTVDASRRQERPLLYALLVVMAAGYWWWLGADASPVAVGTLAMVCMLCIAAMANAWIKLSMHMATLAFAGVALVGVALPVASAAFALLPLLAWSRLRLARHTLPEVVGGTGLGLAAGAVLLLVG